MSLMSLLIALAAERNLSSSLWQFNHYFRQYFSLALKSSLLKSPWESSIVAAGFILVPVILSYLLLELVDDGLIHFIISTLILIVCFGCVQARESYKKFLLAAYRGETTTCELHHKQLEQDTVQPQMSFGQLLVWLNYSYFIAIMIFFVFFGAPGALFYRLLVKFAQGPELSVDDHQQECPKDQTIETSHSSEQLNDQAQGPVQEQNTARGNELNQQALSDVRKWLAIVDWLPVRIVGFGYVFVGHFSKAIPVWLESVFDIAKAPHKVLTDVAQRAEDIMIDEADCTAEPCLLVRLAKRTLLLALAVIAVLILTGIIR